MKKILITMVATVLVCACIVGGTFAWLMDKTEAVENTFTVGMIDITLTETTGDGANGEYKIVPGTPITKDPKVTVAAKSEACWLFIQVTENNWNAALTYTLAGWTELDGVDGVYYKDVAYSTSPQEFPVLTGNQITVANSLKQGDITAVPTLTFQAFAVQKAGFENNVEGAWNEAKNAAVYTQP